jgi:hypothetical protein
MSDQPVTSAAGCRYPTLWFKACAIARYHLHRRTLRETDRSVIEKWYDQLRERKLRAMARRAGFGGEA